MPSLPEELVCVVCSASISLEVELAVGVSLRLALGLLAGKAYAEYLFQHARC